MAQNRIRTRTFPIITGTRTLYGSVSTFNRSGGSESCADTVGNRHGENALQITRNVTFGGTLSGFAQDNFSGIYCVWDNQPIVINPSVNQPSSFKMSADTAGLRGYALTNPSRHSMNAVASIVELKDLPHMLRFAGRLLKAGNSFVDLVTTMLNTLDVEDSAFAHRALSASGQELLRKNNLLLEQQGGLSAAKALASANLAWQFGWKPILSDLDKLVGFSASVDRRSREIRSLYSGKGLKKTIELQNDKQSNSGYAAADTVAGYLEVPYVVKTQTRIWVVSKWKPKYSSYPPPSRQDIMRTLLGFDPHGVLSAGWELLPWSWLAGWCSNIDDYLQLSNNAMNASGTVVVMRSQSRQVKSPGGRLLIIDKPTGKVLIDKTMQPYVSKVESKFRQNGFNAATAFSASIPILGDTQLSILGSIAMLQGLKT